MSNLEKWEKIDNRTRCYISETMKSVELDINELLRNEGGKDQAEMIEDNKKLLTIKDVMELTHYSRSTIIRKIQDGTLKIKTKKKPKEKILIFSFSIKEWLQVADQQKRSA